MRGQACDDEPVTVFEELLAIQELDVRLQQMRHRRSTLPEFAALATNAEARSRVTATEAEVGGEVGELLRSQRRLEDEIAQLVAKAEGHEATLYSGSVNNPRELQALQDDIASLRRRQRELEDSDLELMEQIEPLNERLEGLAADLAVLDDEATRLNESLTASAADIDAGISEVERKRAELAAGVDPAVLADYEDLRTQLGGVAIARLEGGACGGCHLSLAAVELDRIRRLDPNERVLCEECGRLLVR
jgi:predicted  nucleic acid-binding Zn-ribbon protein